MGFSDSLFLFRDEGKRFEKESWDWGSLFLFIASSVHPLWSVMEALALLIFINVAFFARPLPPSMGQRTPELSYTRHPGLLQFLTKSTYS